MLLPEALLSNTNLNAGVGCFPELLVREAPELHATVIVLIFLPAPLKTAAEDAAHFGHRTWRHQLQWLGASFLPAGFYSAFWGGN